MVNIFDSSIAKIIEWRNSMKAIDNAPITKNNVFTEKANAFHPYTTKPCPFCGEPNSWFQESSKPAKEELGILGVKSVTFKCKKCGKTENSNQI